MKAKVEDILINFECDNCDHEIINVPMAEIIEVGAPLCTECDGIHEMTCGDVTIK